MSIDDPCPADSDAVAAPTPLTVTLHAAGRGRYTATLNDTPLVTKQRRR